MSELSSAAELVLRDMDKTDQRALLKASVKELIAAGCWRIAPATRGANLRGTKRDPLTVLQLARSEAPADEPLPYVQWLIGTTREYAWEGATGRELGEVARTMARQRGAGKQALARTLADLAARGLVTSDQRRVLGLVPRTRYARTPAGDALLGALPTVGRPRRRRDGTTATDTAYLGGTSAVGGAAAVEAADESFMDAALDQVESAMDSFDASFDSAFDASFDSAFDSGFDAGGGGDGGGGGGDGGGGG